MRTQWERKAWKKRGKKGGSGGFELLAENW